MGGLKPKRAVMKPFVHVFIKSKFDPAKAKAAGERMLEISRSIKPTNAKGATKLVKEQRLK